MSHQERSAIATRVFGDGKTTDWRTLPRAHIRYRHLEALRTRLREQYAPATVNLVLSAVPGVVRSAFPDGAISTADYLRIKMVNGVEAHRQPAGRSLDQGEATALFRACTAERTPSGTRDAAGARARSRTTSAASLTGTRWPAPPFMRSPGRRHSRASLSTSTQVAPRASPD